MFVGALNGETRSFLAHMQDAFNGRRVVVGCSGGFTAEAVIAKTSKPTAIHSNDVSLYSCLAGWWLTGKAADLQVREDEYAWLAPYLRTAQGAFAALGPLQDMLQFEKRRNDHQVRMWRVHRDAFDQRVQQATERLAVVDWRIDSFFAGDVLEHFKRYEDDPDSVFVCYAPTYAGGYERMYKRLDQIIDWPKPHYAMLDNERRAELLGWMQQRCYVWIDDRKLDGLPLVMEQQSGRKKTVYAYSNATQTRGVFRDVGRRDLLKLPLMTADTTLGPDDVVRLVPMSTADLASYKDIYLSKGINHARGLWAFAIWVGACVVGFLEAKRDSYVSRWIYMNADFPVSGTRYERLSKLMPMLAISGETRRLIERLNEARVHKLLTTAFTDRPVSMKYRGVLNLDKRGETEDGQKFLNYSGEFNGMTWQETYRQWLTKYGSLQR